MADIPMELLLEVAARMNHRLLLEVATRMNQRLLLGVGPNQAPEHFQSLHWA